MFGRKIMLNYGSLRYSWINKNVCMTQQGHREVPLSWRVGKTFMVGILVTKSKTVSGWGKLGEEVIWRRPPPWPRAMNRAVEPSSSAWALDVLNKNLIDDFLDPEQTTLNFNRAWMESLHKGLQFPGWTTSLFSPPSTGGRGRNWNEKCGGWRRRRQVWWARSSME
jgi:hypothetical protein